MCGCVCLLVLLLIFPPVFDTDTENPHLSDTPNIKQATDPGLDTATVSWIAPTANDNSGFVTLSSSYKPGDSFPIGVTTVIYTAIDPYSNKATRSFTVTVRGKRKILDICRKKC